MHNDKQRAALGEHYLIVRKMKRWEKLSREVQKPILIICMNEQFFYYAWTMFMSILNKDREREREQETANLNCSGFASSNRSQILTRKIDQGLDSDIGNDL